VDPTNEYEVFVSAHQARMRFDLPPRFRIHRIAFPRPALGFRALWQQMVLPGILRRRRVDALLSPNEICPLFSPCPVLLCVNNPNPYGGPRASTTTGRMRESLLGRLTAASAHRAGRVFFVTDASRHLIVPKLGIDEAKTTVIRHGVDTRDWEVCHDGAAVLETLGVRRPYLLCVSAVRIHKDIATLVRAFSSLMRQRPDLSLAVAGAVTDRRYHASVLSLIRREGLFDRILLIGEVNHEQLVCLYRNAEVMVLPTRAETFGLPLIEAMAAGLAVVTTDLPVTREVCGEAACYVPAGDTEGMAERMASILGSEEIRKTMVDAGRERVETFSWEGAAREVVKQLEEISS
jgi:glycosyltransferase involved in cell wall biosynthesis